MNNFHPSGFRPAATGMALGLLVLSLSTPVHAGERKLSTETVRQGREVQMGQDAHGKPVLKVRNRRVVKDRVEVDIQVPVERTRQDPVTRYEPKANPAAVAGAPAAGVVTGAHSRTTTAVSVSRDEANHASVVTWSIKRELTDTASALATHNSDWAKEWHSREWDLGLLRSNFGTLGSWQDGYPDAARNPALNTSSSITGDAVYRYEVANTGSGDTAGLLGQASRLLRLAQMIEADPNLAGTLRIQGVNTLYYGSSMPANPFVRPLTVQHDYNGGDWNAIFSLTRAGMTNDQVQRAIYEWYSTRWGRAYTFDVPNATAQQLRTLALCLYQACALTGSPIALDLNHDGRIGVTGRSTARIRKHGHTFVRDGSVAFDLFGMGKSLQIEWMNRDGDALLVDDRDGAATRASQGDGLVSGKQLFGSAGGFDNGYAKLAVLLMQQNRLASAGTAGFQVATTLRGKALEGLKAWIDTNGDARIQPGELRTLDSLGVTEIAGLPTYARNEADEQVLVASFTQNGEKHLAEDVFFAIAP
jgi:hypothetical protein